MLTFFIEQFGCRATHADGAALERQLLERGCTAAPGALAADIVVLNTCTVTAAADAQARDAIRKIHSQNPAARLIVTGCYAQRAPAELAALPGVCWVVGNSHKPHIPQLIASSAPQPIPPAGANFVPATSLHASSSALLRSSSVVGTQPTAPLLGKILTGNIFDHSEFLSAPVLGGEGNHTRPILKIQDGCNSRCSYCVIPFVRGKSRSLPPDAVIAEIQQLTAGQTFLSADSQPARALSPAREIVLSGINLGTYGRDLTPRAEFIDLLRRILDETSVERLRVSSLEPLDVTEDLIDLFAGSNRMAQHFHMPLQSGSDLILAAMHRWYRSEHYARRVELIRRRLPHAAIGADVIAGFPGETEADHATTLAFIARLPFAYLHVFSYSKRPGTKAANLPNQVPANVIKRRARELRSLAEAKSAAFRHGEIGRTLSVLTLRRQDSREDSADDATPALSSNYLRVRLSGIFPPNLWVDVLTLSEEGNNLRAEPVDCFGRNRAFSGSLG